MVWGGLCFCLMIGRKPHVLFFKWLGENHTWVNIKRQNHQQLWLSLVWFKGANIIYNVLWCYMYAACRFPKSWGYPQIIQLMKKLIEAYGDLGISHLKKPHNMPYINGLWSNYLLGCTSKQVRIFQWTFFVTKTNAHTHTISKMWLTILKLYSVFGKLLRLGQIQIFFQVLYCKTHFIVAETTIFEHSSWFNK